MAYATNLIAPGTQAPQSFFYVCTGAEGDSFTIVFPQARKDINYVAVVSLASSTLTQYNCNAPQAGYTTTSIRVITGIPVNAGDVLAVVVTEIQ